ncbi:MAG: AAA family ATPase [Phycisphaerae bacterium]
MKLLSQVHSGKQPKPRRLTLYGVHGVGKSTFGAMSERPVFIQTEDGLADIECDTFPLAKTYADVLAALSDLYTEEHD